MYSPGIKVGIVLLGFTPVLFCIYLVKLIRLYSSLHFYLSLDSAPHFWAGICQVLSIHLILFLSVAMTVFMVWLIRHAKSHLPIGRIEVKSVKSADINFQAALFSLVLPIWKIVQPTKGDIVYLLGYFGICVLYGMLARKSYHYNMTLKLLGYIHHEVQTTQDIMYLVLSKSKIINKRDLTLYIQLSDNMLLNVTNEKKATHVG